MKFAGVVVLTAVTMAWAAPVRAQMPTGLGIPLNNDAKTITPEEREALAARDKAYRDKLKSIPDGGKADPWGNMRGAETKPAPKPKREAKDSRAGAWKAMKQ